MVNLPNCVIWHTINQTQLDGHKMVTARWPQMIGVTLRGCLRTASSLWFSLISLDLSAIAITLGCPSHIYILHHHRTHDNSKEHSSLHDGFYSTVTKACVLTEASLKTMYIYRNTAQAKYITKKFPGFKQIGKVTT